MRTVRVICHYRIAHLLAAFVIILIVGCATPPHLKGVYRSSDYVIHQIREMDTPMSLAEQYLGSTDLAWMIEEANGSAPFQPGHFAVIPLKPFNKGGIYAKGVQQVPILCYHRFGNNCDSPLCVPEDIFEQQMKYLKENNFHVITPEQLLAFLEYRQPLPKKSVLITVDDGYSSFYEVAYPILKKYGFSATLFVYVDFVGVSSKALSWEQLRKLKAEGFIIGSHSIMHSDLSKQGEGESEQAYMERLRHEIFDSKRIIDAKLNQNTIAFAYPFGRVGKEAMQVTRQAGYRLAVTVNRGGNPFFANAHALNRDQILRREMTTFARRLKTFQPLPLR